MFWKRSSFRRACFGNASVWEMHVFRNAGSVAGKGNACFKTAKVMVFSSVVAGWMLAAAAASTWPESCGSGKNCSLGPEDASLLQRKATRTEEGRLQGYQEQSQGQSLQAGLAVLSKQLQRDFDVVQAELQEEHRKNVQLGQKLDQLAPDMEADRHVVQELRSELLQASARNEHGPQQGGAKPWSSGGGSRRWVPPSVTQPKQRTFELCQAKPMALARNQTAVIEASAKLVAQAVVTCNSSTELTLQEDTAAGIMLSCCPISETYCAGCARANATDCEVCQGGYTLMDGLCVACIDSPGWTDFNGDSCFESTQNCSNLTVRGLSMQQTCCKCGGGHQQATSFSYRVETAIIGTSLSRVSGKPVPRTATRYSVDDSCELSKHGLTIDGNTGELKIADCGHGAFPPATSRRRHGYICAPGLPAEPFQVECTVTAHQREGLNATATLKTRGDYLGYKSDLILFDVDGSSIGRFDFAEKSYPLQNFEKLCPKNYRKHVSGEGNAEDCNFEKRCAPDGTEQWMHMNELTGELTKVNSSSGLSGVTGLGNLSGSVGASGAVCTVTVISNKWTVHVPFVVLAPEAWPSMRYKATSVFATVGEEAPPLHVQPPGQGLVPPSRFSAACNVLTQLTQLRSTASFAFDSLTGEATVDGHPAFTLDLQAGTVRVSPSAGLVAVLDRLTIAEAPEVRRRLALRCEIFGRYDWVPGRSNPWANTTLTIELRDDTCWAPVEAVFINSWVDANNTKEEECRGACRRNTSCAHYNFQDGNCTFFGSVCNSQYQFPSCSTSAAQEKILHCGERDHCLQLTYPHNWDWSGEYCPKGDSGSSGPVYERISVTSEDVLWT